MGAICICAACGCPTTAPRIEDPLPDEPLCPGCAETADVLRQLSDDPSVIASRVAALRDWIERCDEAVPGWTT